jgi:hypothetical protein
MYIAIERFTLRRFPAMRYVQHTRFCTVLSIANSRAQTAISIVADTAVPCGIQFAKLWNIIEVDDNKVT